MRSMKKVPGWQDYHQAGELLPALVTPRDRGPKTESVLMVGNKHLYKRVSLESATK